MRFEFTTAGRIIFGEGKFAEVAGIVRELGQRPLVVTGRDGARAEPLLARLRAANLTATIFSVRGEPTIPDINRGTEVGRAANCDCVIGIGGGSALDAAKAIAALLRNAGNVTEYLEVIGSARPLAHAAAPILAIPTTAGTGSEVTRNAVLASVEHGLKVSLRSPHMLPRIALIDPELSYDLPPHLTATTGLDALTQLIEPYVCNRANPLTDAVCVDGIARSARALPRAVKNGHDVAARGDMAVASLFGGIALANAGLGAVHGFAAPIGGKFPAPHGAVCAALLPHVIRANVSALRLRARDHDALRRYEHVARLLTGKETATIEDGIAWVAALLEDFSIPPLARYGMSLADVPAIVVAAQNASSMKANPILLTPEELAAVLAAAI